MPTLGTGNDAGFTLIEVLAVIILLGLISILAYPNFGLGEERVEIIYIGKLITSDLKLVQEDSLVNKSDAEVDFFNKGYQFTLGEISFSRKFNRFGFAFQLQDGASEETAGENDDQEMDTATENNADNTDQEPTTTDDDTKNDDAAEEEETPANSTGITFREDGSVKKLELNWQSNHFQGQLLVEENGTVKWSYERK